MNVYLNEKIIDDQGNVKTVTSGQDARLYYVDVNGERKKYLLEGEALVKELDPIFSAISDTYALKTDLNNVVKLEYETATGDPHFSSNKFLDFSGNAITSLNLSLEAGLTNAGILFLTGDTITYTITNEGNYKVNKAFELEPNSYYLMAVDSSVVLWTKVEEYA